MNTLTQEEILKAFEDDGYTVTVTDTAIGISWEGTVVVIKNTLSSLLAFYREVFGDG